MMPTVHMASSIFPGFTHAQSVARCLGGVQESFGALSAAHIELCPQHHGPLSAALAEQLRAEYPQTVFRLHANVRVGSVHPRYDASSCGDAVDDYFRELADRHRRLAAPCYSLHAGYRESCSLEAMADRVRWLSALFRCRVGIEGLYYTRGNAYLLSTWQEYRWLYESTDLDYVIDLSHLNILVKREGMADMELVTSMLADARCLEVHVSTNDGYRDSHRPVDSSGVWWWRLLDKIHPSATVFSEGVQEMLRARNSPDTGWPQTPVRFEPTA